MRLKALVLSLAGYLLMTMAAHAATTVPTPLVSLDASTLPLGDLLVWYNQGTLLGPDGKSAGQFNAVGAPPQVEMVAGRKAVTFSGVNGFRSNFPCPTQLTASNPFSVSIWALNPSVKNAEMWIFTWTKNGTAAQVSAFGFGNSLGYGAVHHYGGNNDLGWDRGVPSQGVWHNITVTNSGFSAWEKLFVDGILVSVENKAVTLDIQDTGFPFLVGLVDDNNNNYTGSVSSIKAWGQELTYDQVLAVSGWNNTTNAPAAINPPMCPPVVNGGFELPRSWGQNTAPADNRSLLGWCVSDVYNIASAPRGGIGVCGPNVNLLSGGSPWDNGVNAEGNYIMEVAGTASDAQAISQYVYCYTGKTYRLHFAYNAKSTGTPTMYVNINGAGTGWTTALTGTDGQTVVPVDPTGVFQTAFYTFENNFSVPVNGYYAIEIGEKETGTGNVLLLDDVRLWLYGDPKPVKIDEYDKGGLDFGVVAKGSTNDTSLTIHNLSNATLNFGNNYGASTNNYRTRFTGIDSGSFDFGYWDTSTDPAVFKSWLGSSSNWFSVAGFDDKLCPVIRFKPGNTTKVFTATLNLTWSNGTFADIIQIPVRATVQPVPHVENFSFEQPHAADWNGYINSVSLCPYDYYDYLNDNCVIPSWYFQAADGFWYNSKQIGIGVEDRQNTARFLNQGNVFDGRQALFMQTIGGWDGNNPDGTTGTPYTDYSPRTRTIRQYLGGFQPGHSYVISLWAGARNSGTSRAAFDVAFNGKKLTPLVANGPSAVTVTGTSITLNYNSTWTPVYYQYTHPTTYTQPAQEGPYPLDINSYTISMIAGGSKWFMDSTLMLDRVQIYDASTIKQPMANFLLQGYYNDPPTNNYANGRTFDTTAPKGFLFYASLGQNTSSQYIHVWNEGFYNLAAGSGGLNVTGIKYAGANGRHFYNSYTTITNVKGWGNKYTGVVTNNGSADLQIQFRPKAVGYVTDTLVISTNDTTGTYYIPVQGYCFGAPLIQNNSFETPPVYWGADAVGTVTAPGPYAYLWRASGVNLVPPYWTFTAAGGNAGISTAVNDDVTNNGATFRVNNGMIQYGTQALWMQATTSGGSVGNRSCRQRVYGFRQNQTYHFKVWVNAGVYGDNAVNFILRITDPYNSTNSIQNTIADVITYCDVYAGAVTSQVTTPITAVDNINEFTHPYQVVEGDFIAPKYQDYNVELYTPYNYDDSTLLVDQITVDAVVNGVKKWSLFD